MVLDRVVLLDADSTLTASEKWKIPYNTKEIMLQVTPCVEALSSYNVLVQRIIDTDADEFCNMAVLPVADLTTVSRIESPGMYLVPVNGVHTLRVVSGGEAGDVRVYGIAMN